MISHRLLLLPLTQTCLVSAHWKCSSWDRQRFWHLTLLHQKRLQLKEATRGQSYSDNRKWQNVQSSLRAKCEAAPVLPVLWSHQPYKRNPQGFHRSEKKHWNLLGKVSSPFGNKHFPRLCSTLIENHHRRRSDKCLMLELKRIVLSGMAAR